MSRRFLAAVVSSLLVSALPLAAGQAPEQALEALRAAAPGPVEISLSPVTGRVTFLALGGQRGIVVPDRTAATAESRARAFLAAYGDAFGTRGGDDLAVVRTRRDELGMDHVRFRQLHQGVPVTGGEIAVHLRGDGVLTVNGKLVTELELLDVVPGLSADAARGAVEQLLWKQFGITDAELSEPRLEVFNRGLLETRAAPSRLAWFVEAVRIDLREYVWVDADAGLVLLHFSQLPDAKNRRIYDANNGSTLPGTLVRAEGDPPTGDPDADKAYQYSGSTYDFYFQRYGRDSYDNAGAQLRSSVHFCPSPASCPYANAFWNGIQMVYGTSYASADDVVAHELTHAVTEREANLFYYMQSGALNESFSDIFGETVDLTNGLGNDTQAVRWRMGEDLPIGAIRNMMNPGAFGDPAKLSDPNLKCYDDYRGDNGGVHSNSGVPNHAYALMVDGGTYNGRTVTAIGNVKAARIHYRALNVYLLSASDFLDSFNALYRSCMDLAGTGGITGANCIEVRDALLAVEMDDAWPCAPPQAPTPALCPAKQKSLTWAVQDFEGAVFTACPVASTPAQWCNNGPNSLLGSFATSGTHSLWGYNWPFVQDSAAGLLWGNALPANARLQFSHSYGFENQGTNYYDGGVVEYTTNGGGTWTNIAPLFQAGENYGGTISNCCGNPLAGRNAFVRESWGFSGSRYNLATLAGQTFGVRFRLGTDSSVDEFGWFVDDVHVYRCVPDPLIFVDGFESGNRGAWSSTVP